MRSDMNPKPGKKRARAKHYYGEITDAVVGIIWNSDRPLTCAEVMAWLSRPPAGGLSSITTTLCTLAKQGRIERIGRGRYWSTEGKEIPADRVAPPGGDGPAPPGEAGTAEGSASGPAAQGEA